MSDEEYEGEAATGVMTLIIVDLVPGGRFEQQQFNIDAVAVSELVRAILKEWAHPCAVPVPARRLVLATCSAGGTQRELYTWRTAEDVDEGEDPANEQKEDGFWLTVDDLPVCAFDRRTALEQVDGAGLHACVKFRALREDQDSVAALVAKWRDHLVDRVLACQEAEAELARRLRAENTTIRTLDAEFRLGDPGAGEPLVVFTRLGPPEADEAGGDATGAG